MSNEASKIVGTEIQRPMPMPEAEAARGVQERIRLSVEVENPSISRSMCGRVGAHTTTTPRPMSSLSTLRSRLLLCHPAFK